MGSRELTLSLLDELFTGSPEHEFDIRLWDGTTWTPPGSGSPRFTIVLRHPGALRNMFLPGGEVAMAEAYIYDAFDVEGNLEAMFPLADSLLLRVPGTGKRLALMGKLMSLPRAHRAASGRKPARTRGKPHSIQRDRAAVTYHYDTSNDFFALWLDSRMVYSCGYFSAPLDDLETVQERKLEYICRKLHLQRGERFLDIGCGWGGLVLYAAQKYGVDALGITLSKPQADLANERIRRAGLERCSVEVRDYREVEGTFDKIASVGMFEHVGAALLPVYCARAYRLLRARGLFLNHGIAEPRARTGRRRPGFSDRYVFPDGELLPIDATLQAAAESGFEVRDVESLREHYAMTLRHWVRRLEAHHAEAVRFTDEATYRVWRLFMSATAHRFATGQANVYQALLVKPKDGDSGMPLTRDSWYTSTR